MQPILVIQNSHNDGPGLFETFAQERAYPLQVIRRFAADRLPADMTLHRGLCILGSPASANDDQADFRHMEQLILDARARRRPVIGHCFGGQILSRALGGSITRAPHAEIGWSTIEAAPSDWFGAERFPMFQWHYERFSVPPGGQLLARSALCEQQAFSVDDIHLGMQFHCEVDEPKLEGWLDRAGCDEMAASPSPGVQSPDAARQQAREALAVSRRVALHLYARWARALPH